MKYLVSYLLILILMGNICPLMMIGSQETKVKVKVHLCIVCMTAHTKQHMTSIITRLYFTVVWVAEIRQGGDVLEAAGVVKAEL